MKREDYEKLGELERIIYDYLLAAFRDNKYSVDIIDGDIFASDGYVKGSVTFGGFIAECSINEKGFICWHCDKTIARLMNAVPHLERKIVAQTKRIVKQNEKTYREKRIKQLQEELNNLKKK